MLSGPDLKTAAENFEKDYIKSALLKTDGNVAEASRRLGIERSHLYKKMNKYGLR
jgi:DNA-binding NtrC family response regulator